MPINVPIARAQYFWAYGINGSTGKGAIVGPFATEAQAREDVSNLGEVRMFRLPTRDHSKATRIIKAKILRTSGVKEALQRMSHKVTGADAEIPEDDDDDI